MNHIKALSLIAFTYLSAIGAVFAEDFRRIAPSWNYGLTFGGMVTAGSSVDSTAPPGFYRGAFEAFATPYVGALAYVDFATYGRSPGPYGTWVLSAGPIVAISAPYPIKFDGTGGGVPVESSGRLTQADFLAALKMTTMASRDYNFSIFGAVGATVRWAEGTPTGGGGPEIIGHDVAPAVRLGVELSQATANGAVIGWTAAYQHTGETRFETTLPGEGFRFGRTHQFMLGMTVTWGAKVGDSKPPASPQQQLVSAPPTHPRIASPRFQPPAATIGRINGLPPTAEARFAANEVVVLVDPAVSRSTVDDIARRVNLTEVDSQGLTLIPATMHLFRIDDGRSVRAVIQALQGFRVVRLAQPNYQYELQQPATAAGDVVGQTVDPLQYVVQKLRLPEAHVLAKGANVSIAVIDSEIDGSHPDLEGAVAQRYSAVGVTDAPDAHGTGMAGAIAARQRLIGVAPSARLLAVHAFSKSSSNPGGRTFNILKGLDWAASQNVRVINMSFAGPRDPAVQRALKAAYDRGIVLVAAAGNGGPTAPAAYPGADPNVIAVTATDEQDQVYARANRGRYVAIAAPGVNVVTLAPNRAYQRTTGTSVAAAEVSGVVALLLERAPRLSPADIRRILTSTAKRLGAGRRDVESGSGLVDPLRALQSIEPRTASLSLRR